MFVIRTKGFLLMAFFLFIVNDVNCFLSKNTVNNRYESSLKGNVIHKEDIGLYNSTVKDSGRQRQDEARMETDSRVFFAARRRIQFALLPIMYKLGVISTILVGLTVMVLKGLTIGVILLFFALGLVIINPLGVVSGNSFFKLKHHLTPQPLHFHLHPDNFHSGYPVHHRYGPSEPWDKEAIEEFTNYENYDPSISKKTSFSKYPYKYYYPYKGR